MHRLIHWQIYSYRERLHIMYASVHIHNEHEFQDEKNIEKCREKTPSTTKPYNNIEVSMWKKKENNEISESEHL